MFRFSDQQFIVYISPFLSLFLMFHHFLSFFRVVSVLCTYFVLSIFSSLLSQSNKSFQNLGLCIGTIKFQPAVHTLNAPYFLHEWLLLFSSNETELFNVTRTPLDGISVCKSVILFGEGYVV